MTNRWTLHIHSPHYSAVLHCFNTLDDFNRSSTHFNNKPSSEKQNNKSGRKPTLTNHLNNLCPAEAMPLQCLEHMKTVLSTFSSGGKKKMPSHRLALTAKGQACGKAWKKWERWLWGRPVVKHASCWRGAWTSCGRGLLHLFQQPKKGAFSSTMWAFVCSIAVVSWGSSLCISCSIMCPCTLKFNSIEHLPKVE